MVGGEEGISALSELHLHGIAHCWHCSLFASGTFSRDRLHFASHSPFRADRRLYLSQAAIDEQLDAGYVAGVLGGQEQDGLRDLIRGARTAQRNIGK
jgi:hypothetical protein